MVMRFSYGTDGRPLAICYDDVSYYYITNLQGDVVAIVDGSGATVVSYVYDAWGRLISTDDDTDIDLGEINPLRYRGYVYDQETGFYYLQSRYYNPAWGRFLNADSFVSTGQGLLGNNMFAYCNNNPISYSDPTGESLIGAIIGGAIAGALISITSHTRTNPNATVASTIEAALIGAITGGLGGAAGVVSAARGMFSVIAGVVAGVYAGCTTEGEVSQKIAVAITTGLITTIGTYWCAGLDTSGYDTFGTAVVNYSTTIFAGCITEPLIVATQQSITSNGESVTNRGGGQTSARVMHYNAQSRISVMALA